MEYDVMVWIWIILTVIFVAAEVITLGLATIWFAVGALAALIVSIFNENPTIQILVFLAVSILLLLTTRPIAKKYLRLGRVKTNIDSIKQSIGVVVEPISRFKYGTVKVSGNIWTAATRGDMTFEPGETVQVVDVEGVKLIVEKIQED